MLKNPKEAIDVSLSLKIPVHPSVASSAQQGILFEGWLLKKRRKKLQGYARRYFVLHSSGLLSYSFEPGSSIRDKISLPGAAISSTAGGNDIHIDSGRVTFHIKCLTKQDFELWMGSMRKFIATSNEAEKGAGRASISRAAGHISLVHRATVTLDEMAQTIDELSAALNHSDDEDRKSGVSAISIDQVRSPNSTRKEGESRSLLSIFKKSSHSPHNSPRRPNFAIDTYADKSSALQTHEQLTLLLAKLREQHGYLTETMASMSSLHSHPRSPLQRTIGEENVITPTARHPPLWHSMSAVNRASVSTILSGTDGSASIWYDATEGEELGAEEYILENEGDEEGSVSAGVFSVVEGESSLGADEESEVQYDLMADDTPEERPTLHVDRRTRLPAKPSGDEGSLFAVLKKNVGQDLANISFPVTFNEPLTLLQRSAEELEYFDLLDRAAASSDWIERMCYVAAFAVSGYACTKFRSGRKGFTPLLGETFEDTRMNFIAEKVVHKPLIIAYHADRPGWELNATSSGKTKFWGKSFEIIPTGISRVKMGGDIYEWNKPSSFTRNLMLGSKYLEHCGEMCIKNTATGSRCVIDFKETGYWASTPNVVSGTVYSEDGDAVTRLEGKWDEQFAQKLDSNHLKILWRISAFPRDASEYYGYTYFGITLNEITEDIKGKPPCTDSRFRPDVRALEEGDVARAEEQKAHLEQLQRERRQDGKEPKPRWFKQIGGSEDWSFVGDYWESRKSRWKNADIKPLW